VGGEGGLSASGTGSAGGRGRVIIVTNSLVLLGNGGYQRAAVVYDGLPYPGTAPRWEC
jgi:hypothetical protein